MRQQAKSTKLKVAHVFNLGYPRKTGGNNFTRDGLPYVLYSPAGYDLVRYDGKWREVLANVSREIEEFDDINLADYEDTYINLTRKLHAAYRWGAAFCQNKTKYFVVMDDDHGILLSAFEDFTKKTPYEEIRKTYYASFQGPHGVTRWRSTKKYVSQLDHPWRSTGVYPYGYGQIIGVDIMPKLAIATAYTQDLRQLDDGYIGYMLDRLNLTKRSPPGFVMETTLYGSGKGVMVAGMDDIERILNPATGTTVRTTSPSPFSTTTRKSTTPKLSTRKSTMRYSSSTASTTTTKKGGKFTKASTLKPRFTKTSAKWLTSAAPVRTTMTTGKSLRSWLSWPFRKIF